jgi:hypothetical protein
MAGTPRPRLTDRESILRLMSPPEAEKAWPPPGFIPVLVPEALAEELIDDEEALPCRWTVEDE